MKKNVTVGIYVYNGMPYIKDALNSIIDQIYHVDEIVISDNCSSDGTYIFIKEFSRNHSNFKWVINQNIENIGFLKNAKKVIELSSSEYLLLLHADDVLKKDAIQKQMHFYDQNPDLALVAGFEDGIDDKGNIIKIHDSINDRIFIKSDILTFIKETNSYFPFSTVLHRLAILRAVQFDYDSIIADELYWPKVLQKYSIGQLGTALIFRRYHDKHTTYSYCYDLKKSIKEIKKHLTISNYQPSKKNEIKKLLKIKYSDNCLGISLVLFRDKKPIKSMKYLLMSIFLYPLIFFRSNVIWNMCVKYGRKMTHKIKNSNKTKISIK